VEIKIMSWNMAGAKLLEHLDPKPMPVAASYTSAFRQVWKHSVCPWLANPDDDQPDIILLQECIGFEDHSSSPSGRWHRGSKILSEIFSGYDCFFFPAVTSHNNPHPGKWNRYIKGGEVENYIPAYIDVQQGYGICVHKGVSSRKLWVPYASSADIPEHADSADPNCVSCFEPVHISTGLYLGSRDTEPRMVIMGRAKLESDGKSRYLNYLNVHLSTLNGERQGNVRLNRNAGASRLRQVEQILDNIVSAYQETTAYRIPQSYDQEKRDIWIIGGDFNTTPDSAEVSMIRRSGFIDAIPDKRIEDADASSDFHGQVGSKWSLADDESPAIMLDYIFCGLEQYSFPTNSLDLSGSKRPFRPHFENAVFATDHAILFAKIKL
jgi:hypothetical protein